MTDLDLVEACAACALRAGAFRTGVDDNGLPRIIVTRQVANRVISLGRNDDLATGATWLLTLARGGDDTVLVNAPDEPARIARAAAALVDPGRLAAVCGELEHRVLLVALADWGHRVLARMPVRCIDELLALRPLTERVRAAVAARATTHAPLLMHRLAQFAEDVHQACRSALMDRLRFNGRQRGLQDLARSLAAHDARSDWYESTAGPPPLPPPGRSWWLDQESYSQRWSLTSHPPTGPQPDWSPGYQEVYRGLETEAPPWTPAGYRWARGHDPTHSGIPVWHLLPLQDAELPAPSM